MEIIITESQYKELLGQLAPLNEVKTLVDNFDRISTMIDNSGINDPDLFWYIEIKKRFKDNEKSYKAYKLHQLPQNLNVDKYGIYLGSFEVHNSKELQALKPQIISLCDKNNARAYITQNPRSHSSISNYVNSSSHFRNTCAKYCPNQDPKNVAAGQQQEPFDRNGNIVSTKQNMINKFGSDRSGFIFDIDEKDKRVWELTEIILKHFGINVVDKIKTPSGGIHFVCDNVFTPNLPHAIDLLKVFDAEIQQNKRNFFPNKGKYQTVHANVDAKLILYSNVDTRGY